MRILVEVVRIQYANEDHSWVVARTSAVDFKEAATWPTNMPTVVGPLGELRVHDHIEVVGEWKNNARWGMQFAATGCTPAAAQSLRGMETFLRRLPEIGPSRARAIVNHYRGPGALDRITAAIQAGALTHIDGITEARAERIQQEYEKLAKLRDVYLFFGEARLEERWVNAAVERWDAGAADVVTRDPYNLMDVGVPFERADTLALQHLRIEPLDVRRAMAAIRVQLAKQEAQGHTIHAATDLGQVGWMTPELLAEGLALACEYREDWPPLLERADDGRYRGAEVANCERLIAAKLLKLAGVTDLAAVPKPDDLWNVTPHEKQLEAVETALSSPVTVLTGGPGTGKTTIVAAFVRACRAQSLHVALCAPTGKAARRMTEQTGETAQTIHRLLKLSVGGEPMHDEFRPLPVDVVVVDESSMMDVRLAAMLLDALRVGCRLLIVGDVDQLPSVGPGRVLYDIISSRAVPVVRLTQIFRQKADARILDVARDILDGRVTPEITDYSSDCFFVQQSDPAVACEWIVQYVTEHLPTGRQISPLDTQVIASQYKGECGVHALNKALQAALNGVGLSVAFGEDTAVRVNDRVVQTRNNYALGVVNGEQGVVAAADPDGVDVNSENAWKHAKTTEDVESVDVQPRRKGKYLVVVRFQTPTGEDVFVAYNREECRELALAYAVTCHRAQGGQWPAVLVATPHDHAFTLTKPLLYTAVTRGAKQVVILGDPNTYIRGIQNIRGLDRRTTLRGLLNDGDGDDDGPA